MFSRPSVFSRQSVPRSILLNTRPALIPPIRSWLVPTPSAPSVWQRRPTKLTAGLTGWLAIGLLSLLAASPAQAQDQSSDRPETTETAVWIDDRPAVSWGEVESLVRSQVDPQQLDPSLLFQLRRQAQESLAGRKLILLWLETQGTAPTAADVELHVEDLRRRLAAQSIDWQDHLAKLGVTAEEFNQSVRFSIGWRQVLEQGLTEANLQKYFDEHRQHFDGTELELSQIVKLYRPSMSAERIEMTRGQLEQIRQQIEAGELTFEQAAQKFSEGATAEQGGTLGRMARDNGMPEAFSSAAFDLKPSELSPIIQSPIGWHLIRCDRAHPGQATFEQVEAQVRRAATEYLFNWYVEREAKQHAVRYDE